MRIIAGEFKSRKIYSPPDDAETRPIPDRVKESVFSLLRGHFEGAEVFDAFAGTGTIGLEAVSRGAAKCVFIEKDREVVASLKGNIELLGCEDRCEVFIGDALGPGALSRCPRPAHVIFMDPPYAMIEKSASRNRVFDQAARLVQCLDDTGFLVLRTPWPALDRPEPPPGAREEFREDRRPSRVALNVDAEDEGAEGWEEEVQEAVESGAPQREKIALELEGAIGPETHVYRGTAVHLYMKKKG